MTRCFTNLIPICENIQSAPQAGTPTPDPVEPALLTRFSRLFSDISDNRFSRAAADNLYKYLKKIKLKHDSSLVYLLFNIKGIARRLALSRTAEHDLKNALSRITDRIERLAGSYKAGVHLPLVGELYSTDNELQLFYRASRSPVNRDDCIIFADSVGEIFEKHREKEKLFAEETGRLNTFIKELESGTIEIASTGTGGIPESGITTAAGITTGEPSVSINSLGIVGLRKKRKRYKIAATAQPAGNAEIKASISGLGIPADRRKDRKDKDKTRGGRRLKIIIPVAVVIVAGIISTLLFIPPARFSVKGREIVGGEVESQQGVESESTDTSAAKTVESQNQKEGVFTISVGDESSPYRIEVPITILDIYYLTNSIAVKNGYRKMDSPKEAGPDPDWIYPGNLFTLPDDSHHTVMKGDTIWGIAHQFIKKTLEADWPTYVRISEEIDNPDSRTHDRDTLKKELESLKQRSYSENFSRKIDKKIAKLLGEQ